jgi:hypothetical protein
MPMLVNWRENMQDNMGSFQSSVLFVIVVIEVIIVRQNQHIHQNQYLARMDSQFLYLQRDYDGILWTLLRIAKPLHGLPLEEDFHPYEVGNAILYVFVHSYPIENVF